MKNITEETVISIPDEDTITLDTVDGFIYIQPSSTGDEFYASVYETRKLFALLYVALQHEPITNPEIDWAREKLGLTQ